MLPGDVEIEADLPDGVPEHNLRTILENAHLGFQFRVRGRGLGISAHTLRWVRLSNVSLRRSKRAVLAFQEPRPALFCKRLKPEVGR